MLPLPIRLALALDLFLIVLGQLVPSLNDVLPLGHDHFIQLGAMVILGVVLTELADIAKAALKYLAMAWRWLAQAVRRLIPPPNP